MEAKRVEGSVWPGSAPVVLWEAEGGVEVPGLCEGGGVSVECLLAVANV